MHTEDTYSILEFNTSLISPDQLLTRLTKITNSLVLEFQLRSANRDKLIKTGKKDPLYEDINTERYQIESRIEALNEKSETIHQILYIKSAEMKLAAR